MIGIWSVRRYTYTYICFGRLRDGQYFCIFSCILKFWNVISFVIDITPEQKFLITFCFIINKQDGDGLSSVTSLREAENVFSINRIIFLPGNSLVSWNPTPLEKHKPTKEDSSTAPGCFPFKQIYVWTQNCLDHAELNFTLQIAVEYVSKYLAHIH